MYVGLELWLGYEWTRQNKFCHSSSTTVSNLIFVQNQACSFNFKGLPQNLDSAEDISGLGPASLVQLDPDSARHVVNISGHGVEVCIRTYIKDSACVGSSISWFITWCCTS